MSEELYNSDDFCKLAEQYEELKKENDELTADKIHLIQAAMDGGEHYHYTAHDIGYRDLERKVKALEADYIISNRELLILQAELARRDELIKHKEEVIGHIKVREKTVFELLSNTIKRRNKKIAEQADTIRKLKEDAERLASTYVIEVFPHEWVCRGGCHHWARFGEQIDHAPDCPITLHRALMKGLE